MKNIKKINLVVDGLIILILFTITSPFCNAALQIKGFYPVSSKGEYCARSNPDELPNNLLYKDWCQKNFLNGAYIYEAYRQIAFNIEYTPEPPSVDLWQTPFETMQGRSGDCEDAVILFHAILPPHYDSGEVVWGFVHDLKDQTSFPHVWFQLYDKRGKAYIVEPFSGDWNGIIPMEAIKKWEVRQRIIGISNAVISDIMNSPVEHQSAKNFFVKRTAMYDWRLARQVDDVFAKLVNVSRRYKRQLQR